MDPKVEARLGLAMKASVARPARYWLTYVWTWPTDLLAWVAVLFVRVAWGAKVFWLDGLWCELRADSWPARTWYRGWLGTTLGHGGLLGPGVGGGPGLDTDTERHELHHVEQYEAAMLAAFVVGVAVAAVLLSFGHPVAAAWTGGAVWVTGGGLTYLAALLTAWLRGESAYTGSHLEERAYAADTIREVRAWAGRHKLPYVADVELREILAAGPE